MPASRSPRRGVSTPRPRRSIWPWIIIASSMVIAVILAALPASLLSRFLPAAIHADDFSGTVWHGSAGKITVQSRDVGALEWWLHPAAFLHLRAAADLHWVRGAFVLDALVNVDRHGFAAREIKGGGPIEDLHDVGVAAAWRGIADIKLSQLSGNFSQLSAVEGDIVLSGLTSPQVADGADWGGYDVRLAPGSVIADGTISAQLTDTGGPLEVQANLRYSPALRTGLLTGTLKERPDAPQGVLRELDGVSQLRARDAEGRIPVDLEFTF
jgi:Type II secretion system (T2SS), protein N